uniref:Uncharacterized protein n=1 Tax=Oryza rufipogon TaxID=4529 RepID=A0A0E0PQM8_ORYRU
MASFLLINFDSDSGSGGRGTCHMDWCRQPNDPKLHEGCEPGLIQATKHDIHEKYH